MEEIEILVKSFLRPQCLERFVLSVRKFYPKITISVCDDGGLVGCAKVDNFYTLPYYSGIGVGRNYLLRNCKKPYFLMCDDDFIFTEKTDLSKLLKVIKYQSNIGIVSGRVYDLNKRGLLSAPGHLEVKYSAEEGRVITRYFYGDKVNKHLIEGIACIPCRMTTGWFLGNTHLFKEWGIHYRDELKRCEHIPFFLDFPKKLKIYCVPEVIVDHDRQMPEEYKVIKENDIYKRMVFERKVNYEWKYA